MLYVLGPMMLITWLSLFPLPLPLPLDVSFSFWDRIRIFELAESIAEDSFEALLPEPPALPFT